MSDPRKIAKASKKTPLRSISPKAHSTTILDGEWKKLKISSTVPCIALSYGVKRNDCNEYVESPMKKYPLFISSY
jgi:hypothetical protein